MHDKAVSQDGVYEVAVEAIRSPSRRASASRSTARCSTMPIRRAGRLLRQIEALGIDGITVSPGYSLRARARPGQLPQPHRTKQLFRDILAAATAARNGRSASRPPFLNFLAGNETYACTPWGNPTRTVFGWQKPCYLLGEGYVDTFRS
jgi:hypothetical protein